MADILGTSGLAWYQWKKHGRCSGLSPHDYFALARAACISVNCPDVFHNLNRPVRLPTHFVESAFLTENTDRTANMLTVACNSKRIQEIRPCLTKGLKVRNWGPDVVRD